jgi:hypothetical protein
LLPREHESTIASVESPGNEKNGHTKTPAFPDTSGALEKRGNCYKFISNDTVNVVGKMSGEGL